MNSTARKNQFSLFHPTAWLVIFLACNLTGCTICQDCGDLDYPTYGGAWERTRRDSGRVGSIFDPAGARVAVLSPRELGSTDASERSGGNAKPNDAKPELADDPNDDGDASPSDKSKGTDPGSLRDLELENINTEGSELLPPDL